ncbi:hypothetical protein M079_4744 [Bacteroides fragilis str. 3996 N(B) 6]|nr:hypothetical protein M079_4744 [Bacteroides fragilis str. 3996 N(B) 6]
MNFFKGLAKKRFLDINNNFNNSLKIEITLDLHPRITDKIERINL